MSLAPLKWKVTFGHPRKGTDFVVTVEAKTAGEARLKARAIAAERGHTGRSGMTRLDTASARIVLEHALWEAAECL